jgi:hypothetical protein
MLADSWVEHTITAQTGVTQQIQVRRQDDTHSWYISLNQGSSVVDVSLANGGAPLSQGSAAQTFTNGVQYRITVRCVGSEIRVYVNDAISVTITGATTFQAQTGVKVSHAGINLIVWKNAISIPGV